MIVVRWWGANAFRVKVTSLKVTQPLNQKRNKKGVLFSVVFLYSVLFYVSVSFFSLSVPFSWAEARRVQPHTPSKFSSECCDSLVKGACVSVLILQRFRTYNTTPQANVFECTSECAALPHALGATN